MTLTACCLSGIASLSLCASLGLSAGVLWWRKTSDPAKHIRGVAHEFITPSKEHQKDRRKGELLNPNEWSLW